MDRALRYVRLADRNVGYAYRLIGNWNGEATSDQQKVNAGLVLLLKQAAPLLSKALGGVALLAKTGFTPVEARGRAVLEPLAAGEHVAIKTKYYLAEYHGRPNHFEVVIGGMYVRIRPVGNVHAPQLVVPAVHLDRVTTDGKAMAAVVDDEPVEEDADVDPDANLEEVDASEEAIGDPLADEDPPDDDGDTGGELDLE